MSEACDLSGCDEPGAGRDRWSDRVLCDRHAARLYFSRLLDAAREKRPDVGIEMECRCDAAVVRAAPLAGLAVHLCDYCLAALDLLVDEQRRWQAGERQRYLSAVLVVSRSEGVGISHFLALANAEDE